MQIFKYIDQDQLPKFLCGTCTQILVDVPNGVTPVMDMHLKLEINKEEAQKLHKVFTEFKEKSNEIFQ